jgi:hypothetical protein
MGQHRHEDPGTATLAPWCMVRPGGRPVPAFLASGQRSDDLRGQAPERSEGAGPRLVHRSLNARRDLRGSSHPATARNGAAASPNDVHRAETTESAPPPGCGPVRLLTVGVGRPPQRDPTAKRLPCPEVRLAETSAPAPPPGLATSARRDLLPTRTVRPATPATCPLDRHHVASAPSRHAGPGWDTQVPLRARPDLRDDPAEGGPSAGQPAAGPPAGDPPAPAPRRTPIHPGRGCRAPPPPRRTAATPSPAATPSDLPPPTPRLAPSKRSTPR